MCADACTVNLKLPESAEGFTILRIGLRVALIKRAQNYYTLSFLSLHMITAGGQISLDFERNGVL